MADGLVLTGVAFLVVIWAAYFLIFFLQYCRMVPGTERVVVLATRAALFLPLYALFMFISLTRPSALAGLTIPISVVEAYSFYCFFTMIVTNLGGPAKAVEAFRNSGRGLICFGPCCPKDQLAYYKKTVWALFHFMVSRNIIIILAAIAYYTHTKGGKAAYSLLNLAAAILLFYCLAHVVMFYENLFDANRNLFGVMKFALLKFSVGLIVLQGLVCEFLISFGGTPYHDDDRFSSDDKTVRGYCILVLLEYVILALPFLFAFGYQITKPPTVVSDSTKEAMSTTPTTTDGESTTIAYSFPGFVCEVLKVHDVFGKLTINEEANEPNVKV